MSNNYGNFNNSTSLPTKIENKSGLSVLRGQQRLDSTTNQYKQGGKTPVTTKKSLEANVMRNSKMPMNYTFD